MPSSKRKLTLRSVDSPQPASVPTQPQQQAELPETSDAGASRDEMIRNAAYAAYERRGASGASGASDGFEVDDWLEAEREVDARLGARQTPSRDA